MKAFARYTATRLLAFILVACPSLAPSAALAQEHSAFSQQQLEQMLAPVALYPDPLLSQMLMAATYPLEVAEAARWSQMHAELQGDDAVRAVSEEDWDPSVKSLVAFPQVLAWMDENAQWTRTVGDAFLAQEPQVMETVQILRQRAQDAGSLRSDDRIQVVEDANTISVLPANPQIVYVPYYDPLRAFGPWRWPGSAPVYWRTWPGHFIQHGSSGRFFWSPGIVISTGFFFAACDWHRRRVHVVNVNNYYYRTRAIAAGRQANIAAQPGAAAADPRAWRHDPAHRRGVAYRGPAAQRFSGVQAGQRAERRDDRSRYPMTPEPSGAIVTAPRPDGRFGGTPAGAGLAAPRAALPRPEVRPMRPAARPIAPDSSAAGRAAEIRPEIRPVQRPMRAIAPESREGQRARDWRPETRQTEIRREPAIRIDAQAGPKVELRAGRQSLPHADAVRTQARGHGGGGEKGKSSEHGRRPDGRERGRGGRR